jgi:hypothetical protein
MSISGLWKIYVFSKKEHGAPLITVWAVVSSHGLIGSFLFERIVNSEQYLSMLCNSAMLSPVVTALSINIKWCIQMDAFKVGILIYQRSCIWAVRSASANLRSYLFSCWKLYGRMAMILNTHSSMVKFPYLHICVHIQICTITLWL